MGRHLTTGGQAHSLTEGQLVALRERASISRSISLSEVDVSSPHPRRSVMNASRSRFAGRFDAFFMETHSEATSPSEEKRITDWSRSPSSPLLSSRGEKQRVLERSITISSESPTRIPPESKKWTSASLKPLSQDVRIPDTSSHPTEQPLSAPSSETNRHLLVLLLPNSPSSCPRS